MDANSAVGIAAKVAPPVGGAALGLLMQNYRGQPFWMVMLAVTVSLVFGMYSSVGRSKDKAEAFAALRYQAGALWIVSCATTVSMHLTMSTAMITALVTGMAGSPLIERAARFVAILKTMDLAAVDKQLVSLGAVISDGQSIATKVGMLPANEDPPIPAPAHPPAGETTIPQVQSK